MRCRYRTRYRATSETSTDLRAVQELLGHTSPTTTAIYTEVSDESARRAAAAAAL
jgi:integrase/recombinase XerD